LTRASIDLREELFDGWIAGSSPAMTKGGRAEEKSLHFLVIFALWG
jgi:hypothetical protein